MQCISIHFGVAFGMACMQAIDGDDDDHGAGDDDDDDG
jgi:hypothetical protein